MNFQKGDIVKLKSGSMLMTVINHSQGTNGLTVECQWFNFDWHGIAVSTPQTGVFIPEALELAKHLRGTWF